MNCRCIRFCVIVFCFVALQLSWHIPAHSAAAPVKTVIGYATVTARLMPLWIAHEQGIFAKYGIDAQPILIRGAPTLVAGAGLWRHTHRPHRRQRHAGSGSGGA